MEHREDEGRAAATIPTVAGRRIPTGARQRIRRRLGGGSCSGWAEDPAAARLGIELPNPSALVLFFFSGPIAFMGGMTGGRRLLCFNRYFYRNALKRLNYYGIMQFRLLNS